MAAVQFVSFNISNGCMSFSMEPKGVPKGFISLVHGVREIMPKRSLPGLNRLLELDPQRLLLFIDGQSRSLTPGNVVEITKGDQNRHGNCVTTQYVVKIFKDIVGFRTDVVLKSLGGPGVKPVKISCTHRRPLTERDRHISEGLLVGIEFLYKKLGLDREGVNDLLHKMKRTLLTKIRLGGQEIEGKITWNLLYNRLDRVLFCRLGPVSVAFSRGKDGNWGLISDKGKGALRDTMKSMNKRYYVGRLGSGSSIWNERNRQLYGAFRTEVELGEEFEDCGQGGGAGVGPILDDDDVIEENYMDMFTLFIKGVMNSLGTSFVEPVEHIWIRSNENTIILSFEITKMVGSDHIKTVLEIPIGPRMCNLLRDENINEPIPLSLNDDLIQDGIFPGLKDVCGQIQIELANDRLGYDSDIEDEEG